jgi:UDP-glucuronate 4-epimerase
VQPGDGADTHADVSDRVAQFDYKPASPVEQGVAGFVAWYQDYCRRQG